MIDPTLPQEQDITMPALRSGPVADSLALGLSGLCLAHCLALPVLASLLPLFGAWSEAEWVHWLFAGLAAPLSIWALRGSFRNTPFLMVAAATGLMLMFAAAAEYPSHELETPLTVMGSLLVAGVHIWNWRYRVRCKRQDS